MKMLVELTLAASKDETVSVWAVAISIGNFVASRIAYDLLERRVKRDRLKHVLLMDCIGTIRKVPPVLTHLKNASDKFSNLTCPFKRLAVLPAHMTFDGVAPETRELLTLVSASESADLIRFLDRWSRLQLLISKYEGAFDAALNAAAKCDR